MSSKVSEGPRPSHQHKPSVKPVRLFDGGGLYLEIAPSGGKWWRLKYRHGSQEKRLSLGTYPDVSLKTARARRESARQQLAEGEDPSALRKAAKATEQAKSLNTLEAVSRAWLKHRSSAWVARTRTMIAASLENDVFPKLGERGINGVQPGDIRALVQGIEARDAGETATRVFQRLVTGQLSGLEGCKAAGAVSCRPRAYSR